MHRDRTHQLPPDGTEYHQFYRVPGNRWWRGLLVLVVAIIGYLVLSTLATLLGGVLTVLGLDGGEQ